MLEHDRLLSLIEFAQETARLRINPVYDFKKSSEFGEYEHSLRGLPGLYFNEGSEVDEVWLKVDRLRETQPPAPTNPLLKIWLDLSNTPAKEPVLKNSVERYRLVAISFYKDEDLEQDFKTLVQRKDFEAKDELDNLLRAYIQAHWNAWAIDERKRRQVIKLYSQLFTLKQQLEGGIVDTPIEVVWGIGMGIWKNEETRVSYPLITQLVDISVNESSMAIELRPRNTDARLELDIYTVAGNPGCADLQKAWKEFNAKQTQSVSPFDRGSFDGILRYATACLDAKGIYWPSQTHADDRTLPIATDELKITDTWTLFARPRSKSLFIQDLDRFKNEIKEEHANISLPRAVLAVVSDPSKEHVEAKLPAYRGMSMVYGNESSRGDAPNELYFPMAFNDDQVRIVQLLESHDGVVVQGPPGTGKTHTIANIICHYFALGKRVLVTSMKEPALAVLRDKLPEEVRALAISLLASEQEGMKQFEHAIYQISSEIQRIDRNAYRKEIADLEGARINELHGQLAAIDNSIETWAKKSLRPIVLDGIDINPVDAAKEVIASVGGYEWLRDKLYPKPEHSPKFTDADITTIRRARKTVSSDLAYLFETLPQIDALPTSKDIIRLHQNLSRHAQLSKAIELGELIPLAGYDDQIIESTAFLIENIQALRACQRRIKESGAPWTEATYIICRNNNSSIKECLAIFDKLSGEISNLLAERKKFIVKPVALPQDADRDDEIIKAVRNKIENKLPFGMAGLIGKSQSKARLLEIKVVSKPPTTVDDWQHVENFLTLMASCRELLIRWNTIATELGIEIFVSDDPALITAAESKLNLVDLVRERIAMEEKCHFLAADLIAMWEHKDNFADKEHLLQELSGALENHILRHKLSSSWAEKENFQKTLSRFSGEITDRLKAFANDYLGNPDVSDIQLQNEWSALMERLSKLHGLAGSFADIKEICNAIKNSGAEDWAEKLQTHEVTAVIDALLPDDWRKAWRLCQLSNYLADSDGRMELKKLFRQRQNVESDLAKTYRDVIVKRTWLKLSENATPDVRSALEAFRGSIAKIGKGTGVRAARHRQDARNAASRANHVIPCWIMPHWRVSESLPSDFGCFDLVIIDESSQSDLTALPALLRANKVLIVGDDKQVSPDGIGLEEEKIKSLMNRYLSSQVELYRPQMTPERSIYDLFKVVFASSSTMLKEHFRCVGPIIEYSKREFYNHALKPVRLAKASERLDPPLIDVFIEDGYKREDGNPAEARFIVDEIKRICEDPAMSKRTIGVVSLLGDKQALNIWKILEEELGPEEIKKHQIACGDARTFQGKEKSIMFLSMVSVPGDVHAQTRDSTEQRFNVAASRAQDRMYLVRSVHIDHLSPKDVLRRGLITHFKMPFAQDQIRTENLRLLCESDFEREVYDLLTERGYRVSPQVKVGDYRIDMVVEAHNDTRLAVECDGDQYHGVDKWEDDMRRQRTLERVGWQFWRCFASVFVKNRNDVIEDLVATLKEKGIEPIGGDTVVHSIHTESRSVIAFPLVEPVLPIDETEISISAG